MTIRPSALLLSVPSLAQQSIDPSEHLVKAVQVQNRLSLFGRESPQTVTGPSL